MESKLYKTMRPYKPWQFVGEMSLTKKQIRSITDAEIRKGEYGLYARCTSKDGSECRIPLDNGCKLRLGDKVDFSAHHIRVYRRSGDYIRIYRLL